MDSGESKEPVEENEIINEELPDKISEGNEEPQEGAEEDYARKASKTKKKHLKELADLVSKNYVNEDEFRDIVKRNAKSDDKIKWSLRQEILLKEIAEKSLCYCFIHREESNRYRKLYDQSMMTIFSQTMIASVLMFISSGFQCTEIENMFIIPLVSGIMNLLIAFQQKILEFKQPERYMLEHETTSRNYKSIYNDIRKELALERKERAIMPDYLNDMHDRYISENKNAPYVCMTSYSKYLNILCPERKDGSGYRNSHEGIPEDVIGFRDIRLDEHDVNYSEVKYKKENQYEKMYLLKKLDDKLEKLKKRYDLDTAYESDSDVSIIDDLSEDYGRTLVVKDIQNSDRLQTKATINGKDWISKHSELTTYIEKNLSDMFGEGTIVEGNYKGIGKWYRAKIHSRNAEGTYDVHYDDGEREERVGADRVRLLAKKPEVDNSNNDIDIDNIV